MLVEHFSKSYALVPDSSKKNIDSFDTRSISIDTLLGIRPMKSLAPIPYTAWEVAALVAVIFLLLSLILYIYVSVRKSKKLPIFPQKRLDYLQWAQDSLEDLHTSDDFKKGNFYLYHKQVSLVIRTFISRHLGIDAVYLSSLQTLQALDSLSLSPPLTQVLQKRLFVFFEQADLVKYAGQPSSETHAEHLHQEAHALLLHLNDLRRSTEHG